MQQPPIDLRMPATEHVDRGPNTGLQWIVVMTVLITLGAFIALMVVHGEHEYHGDRAMTPEYQACWEAEMDAALNEMRQTDFDHCKPVMPWYAAHPFWYAAIVGLAAFVIGRVGLFMVRMERARGY